MQVDYLLLGMQFMLNKKPLLFFIMTTVCLSVFSCKNVFYSDERSGKGAAGPNGADTLIDKSEKEQLEQFTEDASADNLYLSCSDRKSELPEMSLSGLTKDNYIYIIEDLMDRNLNDTEKTELVSIITKANAPESKNGYIGNASLSEDQNFASSRFEIGEFIGELLAPKLNVGCDNKECTLKNLSDFLQNYGEAIYGFSFDNKDISKQMSDLLEYSYTQSNSNYNLALTDTLTAFFAAPYFHLRNFSLVDSELEGFAIAQKLSFLLIGSIPDAQLIADAKSGRLKESKTRLAHVERLLGNDNLLKRFAFQFVSQFFRFNASYDFSQENTYNDMKAYDVFNSAISAFEYLLKNNKPLDQFIELNEIFANTKMAEIYGLAGANANLTKIASGDNLSGLLFHPITFLSTAGGNEKTLYVYRGLQLMSRYLCLDLPPLSPANFKELEQVSEELKEKNFDTAQEIIRYHRANENCNICHQHIDGLGVGFENFDSQGNFRSKYENGTKVDTSGVLLGKTYKNQGEMRKILSASKTFQSCMVRQLNSFATQYSPFKKSGCMVGDVISEKETNIGYMDAIKKIVGSEQFVLRK